MTYRPVLFAAAMLLSFSARDGFSNVAIVAPNSLAGVEGNTYGAFPFDSAFGPGGMRYQQVFAASQFSAISAGGGYILEIDFRFDMSCTQGDSQDEPLLQINMSTTSKGPDSLSATLSQNVGADDKVVRGARDLVLFGECGPGAPPQGFTVAISMDSPFYYNPNAGNLLLDIRNFSGPVMDGRQFRLDVQNVVGDSISSLLAFNTDATSASQVDSSGFVTYFAIQPVPEPSTWALLGLGLSAVAFSMRRKFKRSNVCR